MKNRKIILLSCIKFGPLDNYMLSYIHDSVIANLLYEIYKQGIEKAYVDGLREGEQRIFGTFI